MRDEFNPRSAEHGWSEEEWALETVEQFLRQLTRWRWEQLYQAGVTGACLGALVGVGLFVTVHQAGTERALPLSADVFLASIVGAAVAGFLVGVQAGLRKPRALEGEPRVRFFHFCVRLASNPDLRRAVDLLERHAPRRVRVFYAFLDACLRSFSQERAG